MKQPQFEKFQDWCVARALETHEGADSELTDDVRSTVRHAVWTGAMYLWQLHRRLALGTADDAELVAGRLLLREIDDESSECPQDDIIQWASREGSAT